MSATSKNTSAEQLSIFRRTLGQKAAACWRPIKRLKPSQWAEENFVLPPNDNAEPGRFRNSRTPYLAGIIDAIVERGVEQVNVLKGTQVGFSTGQQILVGYWVDHDPGPTMPILPDEKTAREVMDEKFVPMFDHVDAVGRHLIEQTATAAKFDTMGLYMAWAGSPQALARRAIRYLLPDEVDKYPPFAGKEADPISLALKRTSTFGHRARMIAGSSPTTRKGTIWRLWETCTDHRRYYVPCPHCGEMQALCWANVRYPQRPDNVSRVAHAETVEGGRQAFYECAKCEGKILEQHKPRMILKGEWRSDVPGASNRRIGFHLPALYSPWVTFSQLAGEFIRAVDDVALMMDFRNSRLAEPFEERASATDVSAVREKVKLSGPPMVVPRWAMLLIGHIDVQSDHLWYVIRAWGPGRRSALVAYGFATTFEDARRIMFDRAEPLRTEDGELIAGVHVTGVDARGFGGKRRDEVFAFAQSDPRIWPMMGAASSQAAPVTEKRVVGYDVVARTVNANYWKDVLHGYIHDQDPTKWLPHSQVGDDYLRHLSSEHKIYDPHAGVWTWVPVTKNARVDLWDCEYNNCCLAEVLGVGGLVDAIPPKQEPPPRNDGGENPMGYKGKW